MTTQGDTARERIERVLPLSPLQQGILFHAALDPDADPYVEQVNCRLRGPLARTEFKAAWEQVLTRHAAFRVSFQRTDQAQAWQLVHRRLRLPWTELDLSDVPEPERKAQLEALSRADWSRGFDVGRPPLFRLTLFRCSQSAATNGL